AVAFLSLPRGDHDKADTGTTTVASRVPAGAGEVELSHAPAHQARFLAKAVAAKEQQKEQQDVASTTSHEPDVLIQPEEEELLKRFYAGMRNPVGEAKVVVTDNHEVTPKSLVIEQIEVRDLRIENLDEESGLAQTGTK